MSMDPKLAPVFLELYLEQNYNNSVIYAQNNKYKKRLYSLLESQLILNRSFLYGGLELHCIKVNELYLNIYLERRCTTLRSTQITYNTL